MAYQILEWWSHSFEIYDAIEIVLVAWLIDLLIEINICN